MPFSKAWDNKVKIAIFPYRRNNYRTCHNCYSAFRFEKFNSYTGLCRRCTRLNPVQNHSFETTHISNESLKCEKCAGVIKRTNFGISRNLCKLCCNENIQVLQRCLACAEWKKYQWNNLCGPCLNTNNIFLCDKNGYTFMDKTSHFQNCWCLTHEDQTLRQQMQVPPTSNIIDN